MHISLFSLFNFDDLSLYKLSITNEEIVYPNGDTDIFEAKKRMREANDPKGRQ